MIREIKGVPFEHICEIAPDRDGNGALKEFMPQNRYVNRDNRPIHDYGRGPFCKFAISPRFNGRGGVYVLLVDGSAKYVGRCDDLGVRFGSHGYGTIQPINCYKGGQETNCRVNSLILGTCKRGGKVELLFRETQNRDELELMLITAIQPEWNRTAGSSARTESQDQPMVPDELPLRARSLGTSSSQIKRRAGVYEPLKRYLNQSKNRMETLTFTALEDMLGRKLPESATTHREWWANGGHSQANAWLHTGWLVDSVCLGRSVTFRKVRA